jgi:hypothetical protein
MSTTTMYSEQDVRDALDASGLDMQMEDLDESFEDVLASLTIIPDEATEAEARAIIQERRARYERGKALLTSAELVHSAQATRYGPTDEERLRSSLGQIDSPAVELVQPPDVGQTDGFHARVSYVALRARVGRARRRPGSPPSWPGHSSR